MAYNVSKKKKAETESDGYGLEKFVQWVDDAEEKTKDAREESERNRDYYDGKQWTDEEVKKLTKRGQAAIVINRIKPKIDFLLGLERNTRTDPKAFPRNYPADEGAAEAATDALRYIADQNHFNVKVKSRVFENMCVEGYGAGKVEVKPSSKNTNDKIITIKRIPWDRFFYDPCSVEIDYSDALYLGEHLWMDLEDAIAKFPDKKEELTLVVQNTTSQEGNTYDDKPRYAWADKKRQRLKIVEMWYRKGSKDTGDLEYCQIIFTKDVEISHIKGSPYIDSDGEQEHPYIATSAYIDRDNNRYGVVKQYMGVQDEINKRRSKALHLLSVRQMRVDPSLKSQYQSANEVRSELAKADGVIYGREGEVEVLQTTDMATGQLQLLQEAKQEIDAVGVNAALAGKNEQAMSGRALQTRQQGGIMELGSLFDNLRMWQHQVYVKCWNRVKQYWTEEKWIRVTDDENKVKFVGLNQQITHAQVYQEMNGQPPQTMGQDPRWQATAGSRNNVADIDIDIIIDESPDTITLQQEQFDTLAQIMPTLAQANPQTAPALAQLLFEASSIRNKQQVMEKLKGGNEDPQQAAMAQQLQEMQAQMAEMAQKLELREKDAKIKKTEAETQKIQADTAKSKASAIKDMAELSMQPQMPEQGMMV